jgi:hypothetical protein
MTGMWRREGGKIDIDWVQRTQSRDGNGNLKTLETRECLKRDPQKFQKFPIFEQLQELSESFSFLI